MISLEKVCRANNMLVPKIPPIFISNLFYIQFIFNFKSSLNKRKTNEKDLKTIDMRKERECYFHTMSWKAIITGKT